MALRKKSAAILGESTAVLILLTDTVHAQHGQSQSVFGLKLKPPQELGHSPQEAHVPRSGPGAEG